MFKIIKNYHRYGINYFISFVVPCYFSQWGKEENKRIYQKITLFATKDAYFYGRIQHNPYFWGE